MQEPDAVYLCAPFVSEEEQKYVRDALRSDWITTVGPHVRAFEEEFCKILHPTAHAAALSSGTAALRLAFRLLDLKAGDEVFCSSFTFIASVGPAVHMGAKPVFIDSDEKSWNMDPNLVVEALRKRAREGRLPAAVVLVHIYGHSAEVAPIVAACKEYEVPLIEDAAEALGTRYQGSYVGMSGDYSVFSFNGNKLITTGGGGMLVSANKTGIERAKYLAFQAKQNCIDYVHEEVGYNHALSNVLAAIGRGQLENLEEKLRKKKEIYRRYQEGFENTPGLSMMPVLPGTDASHWLSVLRIDPEKIPHSRESILVGLAGRGIQARPVWKPLHTQPVFRGAGFVGSGMCERVFQESLCLPSGVSLTAAQQDRVVTALLELLEGGAAQGKRGDARTSKALLSESELFTALLSIASFTT